MMEEKMKYEIFKELIVPLERYEISDYVICAAYSLMFGEADMDYITVANTLDSGKLIDTKSILNKPRRKNAENLQYLVKMMITGDYSYFRDAGKNNENMSLLAGRLLEINENDTVLDLGCGEGSFLMFASELSGGEAKLVGCDIDEQSCNVGKLAMKVLGIQADFLTGDYVNQENELVLPDFTKAHVFPPFSLKQIGELSEASSKVFSKGFTKRNSFEWRFVDRLIGALKDGTKAVAALPEKALYYNYDDEYREFLTTNGFVEGVIELPRNTANGTGIKIALVVFSKGNTSIRLMNADTKAKEYYEDAKGYDTVKLYVDKILEKYYGEDDGVVKTTKSIDDIMTNTSKTLLPSNLMAERARIENGVALEDLGEVRTGTQYTIAKFRDKKMLTNKDDIKVEGRILTSEDIAEDGHIDLAKLDKYVKDVGNFKYNNAVHKGDIVITSKSSKVKVAVIEEEPEGALIVTGGMLIVDPDSGKVDPRYIKLFLDSEDGEKELKYIQKGTLITSINRESLAKLEIPYIPIEEQRKLGDQMDAYNADIRKKQQEIKELQSKLKTMLKK